MGWSGRYCKSKFTLGDNPAFQSESFSILGLPENGTLASMVDVPIENLFHKPAHLTHEQAQPHCR